MNEKNPQNWSFLAKPHINLRDPKGNKPTPLYLVFRINEQQYKIPVGVKVIPNHWIKKEYKAMISANLSEMENRNNFICNKAISEIFLAYNNFLNYLCTQNDIDVKECINKYFGGKRRTVKKERLSATLSTVLRNRKMSEASYKIFNGILSEFIDWVDDNYSNISLSDFTIEMFKGYKEFLFNKKITHKITGKTVCQENNTVLTKLKAIITIIGYLDEYDELCSKLKRTLKDIKVFSQSENQVFLDDSEIEAIYNLSLEGNTDIARDLFIFQLSSGQRYSDIHKLCGMDLRSYINGDFITIIQKKTKAKVSFPINDKAKTVLEKYSYVLPKMANDKINKQLKVICKKAELHETVHCVELRGGDVYEYEAEKWQLIGTHTTRRSFISNAIKENIDTSIIRKISGHKTDSAFNRYNRIDSEDAVQAMLNAQNTSKTSGNASSCPSNNMGGQSRINEYKRVLAMLNVDAFEWIDIDNEEELFRLIVKEENRIQATCGCDYKTLKDLFNDKNLSLKEKVDTIKHMLK